MRSARRLVQLGFSALLLAGALGGVALPTAAAAPSPAVATMPGYATPEDAVTAYLEAVKAADIEGVLATAAIDEMAQGFDFVAQVDRLRVWMPNLPAPATDPFLTEMDRIQLQSQLLSQTRGLVYGLLTDLDMQNPSVVQADADWAKALVAQLDLSRLAGLEIGPIADPAAELSNSQKVADSFAKQAAIYGADELVERVATIGLDGKAYQVGFGLIRYGDTWKVTYQVSNLAGMPATGAPLPVGE
ncbi:MAG: hypothetical protein U0869_04390 [Chloroflexota bacterium]